MPGVLPQAGFVHSIREKGSNVKIKLENVTQSQQFKRRFDVSARFLHKKETVPTDSMGLGNNASAPLSSADTAKMSIA